MSIPFPLWLFDDSRDDTADIVPGRVRVSKDAPRDVERVSISDAEQVQIDRIRAGDTEAFDALVDTSWDLMVRVAHTVLGHGDAACDAACDVAQDVAQDVFARLWQRRDTWHTAAVGIQPYLIAAVRRRAIDYLRMQRAASVREGRAYTEQAIGSLPSTDDGVTVGGVTDAVAAAIAALPERRRLLVQLRFYEGMTYPAIASVLGISTKSAEQLAARVLDTLRHTLRHLR